MNEKLTCKWNSLANGKLSITSTRRHINHCSNRFISSFVLKETSSVAYLIYQGLPIELAAKAAQLQTSPVFIC
jgi:hypothetical protein